MYILTEDGLVPCQHVLTEIVLNYYGEGRHETLAIAKELGLGEDFTVERAIIHLKLEEDESILFSTGQSFMGETNYSKIGS